MKREVQRWVAPLARRVSLPPNIITLLGLLAMIIAGGFVLRRQPAWAGAFILLSGFLDILDGAVAKALGQETRFGALLDRVSDRIGDCVILSSIVLAGYVHVRLGLFVLLSVVLASYISACMEGITATRIGEDLSLRGVRLVILVLASFSGRFHEGMILLALIGVYAIGARMLAAYRALR